MNKANLSLDAVQDMNDLPREVARYIIKGIWERLPQAGEQMVVKGMTQCGEHIYRVFKFYAFRPGHRVIFHFISPDVILIDSVCRRDQNPYGDGK
jgi:hypothetical protein